MKVLRLLVPMVLAVLLLPTTLSASTILNFEGDTGFAQGVGTFLDLHGFRFTITAGNTSNFEVVTAQANLIESNTTKLFAANYTEVTMTRVDGAAFDLLGLDIGGSWTDPGLFYRWADHVDVITSAGTATAILNGHPATYVHVSANLLNVTSVRFAPTVNANQGQFNYEFVLDNLEVSTAQAVPEPSTMVLLGLGLSGLAWSRKRAR